MTDISSIIRRRYDRCKEINQDPFVRLDSMGRPVRRGVNHPMYGKKHSIESKLKMSKTAIECGKGKCLKGRKLTEDHKQLLSLAKIGKKLPTEHKKNISKAAKERGFGKWMMGKKLPDEVREKISESNRGEKGNNWKGGITKLYDLIRHSSKYRQWRKSVFERDNYTCQECGAIGGDIQVDHYPNTFAHIIHSHSISSLEEAFKCLDLWDTANNRTLCVNCHKKTPTYLKGLLYV